MEMVNQSHNLSKAIKEIPQETIENLARKSKELWSNKTVHIPITLDGYLKLDLDWTGPDHAVVKVCDVVTDQELTDGIQALKLILNTMSDYLFLDDVEEISAVKKLRNKSEAIRDEIFQIADEYGADDREIDKKIADIFGESEAPERYHYRNPRRAKRRRRRK